MSNPKIQTLEFLLHENGLPWKENLMWAVYDETQPDNFRIEREKPSNDESYIDISDVKQWYLRVMSCDGITDGRPNRQRVKVQPDRLLIVPIHWGFPLMELLRQVYPHQDRLQR